MKLELGSLVFFGVGVSLLHCSDPTSVPADASLLDVGGGDARGNDDAFVLDGGDAGSSGPPTILWGYHKPNGSPNLRSTMAMSNGGAHVWTGGFWGGGKLFKVAGGDGTPLWEYEKPGCFGVAAAKSSDVLYGVWDRKEDNGPLVAFEVSEFTSASSTPLWTYNGLAEGYTQHSIDTAGLMATSADGNVLAVAAQIEKDTTPVILFFRKGEGKPYATHVLPSGGRQLRMSDDGSTLLVHGGTEVRRIDTKSGAESPSVEVGSGTDAFGMSADASVFVQGFFKLKAYRWNGSSYDAAWEYSLDGKATSGAVAVADDNDSIVAAWTATSTNQLGYVTRFSLKQGNVPTWRYDLKPDKSTTGQSAAWAAISSTGAWSAVSWWGTEHNVNPEVTVFRDEAPSEPYFGIDLPGSGFVVGMTNDGRYLTAVGKGVHANETGNGGSVVAAEIHR